MHKQHSQSLKRAGLLLVLIALLLLYFPINRNVQGGISPVLPIDRRIELAPVWAIPYLLGILWWAWAILWAAAKMDYQQYLQFFICLVLTISVSYSIYLVFPTYIVRPEIETRDFLSQVVAFIYGNDMPHNALPSGHTYLTLIITIFWVNWYPRQRLVWMIIAVLVILSTLFTKQHAILDLVAASVLVWICYLLSGYLLPKVLRDPQH